MIDIFRPTYSVHIDGLVLDRSDSSALATELLQACTETSIYAYFSSSKFCIENSQYFRANQATSLYLNH